MQHKPLVFLDIETTGGSAQNCRVLEIGALRVENNQIVEKFDRLIHPDAYVPSFITGITGIDDDMVQGAPRFHEIAKDLSSFLDGAIFIAHHVSFDYGFIKQEYARMGELWSMDRMCTVRLSRTLFPGERYHSLNHVIERHGYKVANRHRAYDDAEVLSKFYFDSLDKHGEQLYSVMNRLLVKTRSA